MTARARLVAVVLAAALASASLESRASPPDGSEPDAAAIACVSAHACDELASGALDGLAARRGRIALERRAARGVLTSAWLEDRPPFDEALVSLNAAFPAPGATVRVTGRVRLDDGTETDWLPLGILGAPDEERRVPRSEPGPADGPVLVATDTLAIQGGARGRAIAYRLEVDAPAGAESPRIARVAVATYVRHAPQPPDAGRSDAWGRVLEVPRRSQMVEAADIRGRICSPTSLAMVLAYHGRELPTAEVARQVYDHGEDIYGNWALNVAFAGRLGLEAEVVKLPSLAALEAEIAASRPVVISHCYGRGDLAGAPVSATDGHLIVVKGFTASGDVVVNDPAAPDERSVERIYRRAELAHTWLENAGGIAYLVRPAGSARR